MTTHEILHIIRNPWGWSEEEARQARIAAADLIEQQAKRIAELEAAVLAERETCAAVCDANAAKWRKEAGRHLYGSICANRDLIRAKICEADAKAIRSLEGE